MSCERVDACVFYKTHRYKMSIKQYEMLVNTYCEGDLYPVCRRKKYREDKGEEPPDNLCPNGYAAGSHQRIY